jgi:diaminopimelate epimerase
MQFIRSQVLGDDYLVMDPEKIPFTLDPAAVRIICDPHRGVGSYGIVLGAPAEDADFGIRIFAANGSEVEVSDDAVRIFAKFAREHGYTTADRLTVRMHTGVVTARLEVEDGRVAQMTTDVGRASFDRVGQIEVDGERLEIASLSVGTPQYVVIVPDLSRVDLHRLGSQIEGMLALPTDMDLQFAQVISRQDVRVETWTRGAGRPLASGASSCAAASACRRARLVDEDVTVTMSAGQLAIHITEDGLIRMRGPAEEICTGDLSEDLVRQIHAA